MGYPKKHRGRRKQGSKKEELREKIRKNKLLWSKLTKLNPLVSGYL